MRLRHLLNDAASRDTNRIFTAAVSTVTNENGLVTTDSPSTASKNLTQYSLYYVAVPLVALAVVALVSLVICLLVRRHRSLNTHQLIPVFHYDPQEDSGWESDLLDDADPPFVRDNQRPIVRGTSRSSSEFPSSNGTLVIKT
ncbi:hypothetical protein EB796_015549 [Bugula neritina]|uniref:Uncharacterized protein n=1 Tax=Bugula neritina TaxID=10212 RepID=A0A7J7JKJ5_BUGNE|nr:hypothetical protein EB796_015549 [Bugula neritina]